MYFRVRASLTERPGALAELATRCGDAGLNILGLQIFPDLGKVTDELVLSAPETWTAAGVSELVSGAGGDEVSVEPCTTHDLVDQPTRWLSAAADLALEPERLSEVLAGLLGPAPERWSATEHARAAALAALVDRFVDRPVDQVAGVGAAPAPGASVEYDESGSGVLARIGGHVVGAAAYGGPGTQSPDELGIEVAPAWRRLGIGTALLTRAAAQAAAAGREELVLVAPADDDGFVPMVCNAGFRARLRVSAGVLRARVTLTGARV